MASRWYTLNHHVFTTDIQISIAKWHQGFVSRRSGDRCKVPLDGKCQFAPLRHLLQISCQPSASSGVQGDGTRWSRNRDCREGGPQPPSLNLSQIRSSACSMGPSGFHIRLLKKHVAGNHSQEQPTKIKVSPPGYSHYVQIFFNAGARSLVPSWKKMFYCQW